MQIKPNRMHQPLMSITHDYTEPPILTNYQKKYKQKTTTNNHVHHCISIKYPLFAIITH